MQSIHRVAGALLLAACSAPAFGWWQHPRSDAYRPHWQAAQAVAAPAAARLPLRRLTPGAIDPRVTQANLRRTICRPGGYTRSVRPPERYTERLKRRLIAAYGYADRRLGHYELDHLIPLGVGGAPRDPRNLWPQPHRVVGGWGSYAKDRLELRLHDLVCPGRLPLARALRAIADDWIAAYRRYLGPRPDDTPMRWMRREDR